MRGVAAGALVLLLGAQTAGATCIQECQTCRDRGLWCHVPGWSDPCLGASADPTGCGSYSGTVCYDSTFDTCAPPPPPAPLDGHPPDVHEHRIVAYMANWKSCPSDDMVARYTHIMVAFGTTYTNPGANSAACTVGGPVLPCTDHNAARMIRWRAAGKKIIMSIGGWAMNGHWDNCFGKEQSLIQQLKDVTEQPQSEGWEYDGVDIDFEQDNIGTTNFLSEMSIGLKKAMPNKEVTHAPMDSDLTSGHKYVQQLLRVDPATGKPTVDFLDFIAVQYYNGHHRPNTVGYNAAGGCGLCTETTSDAVARMVALFRTSACDDACAQTKVVFGFCNGDCAGTGSNIDGSTALQVTKDFDAAFPQNGGIMFWEASWDTGANLVSTPIYDYYYASYWHTGPTVAPVPTEHPTVGATMPPTAFSPTVTATDPPTGTGQCMQGCKDCRARGLWCHVAGWSDPCMSQTADPTSCGAYSGSTVCYDSTFAGCGTPATPATSPPAAAATQPPSKAASPPSCTPTTQWLSAKTTRYWDCCKPSCSWAGNTPDTDKPVEVCGIDGKPLTDYGTKNICGGGGAAGPIGYMCHYQMPWEVSSDLAFGYAAANLPCGTCYELQFTSTALSQVGKRMILQVTNSGSDLGQTHFDIQLPGGGLGIFNGCAANGGDCPNGDCQFQEPYSAWGARYGGVTSLAGCAGLPVALQVGCQFRFGWFENADNPTANVRRVKCPAEITQLSGSRRNDDNSYCDVSGGGGTAPPIASLPPQAPATVPPTSKNVANCPANTPSTCDCSWTGGGANCGVDDSSDCWCQCCCPSNGGTCISMGTPVTQPPTASTPATGPPTASIPPPPTASTPRTRHQPPYRQHPRHPAPDREDRTPD